MLQSRIGSFLGDDKLSSLVCDAIAKSASLAEFYKDCVPQVKPLWMLAAVFGYHTGKEVGKLNYRSRREDCFRKHDMRQG